EPENPGDQGTLAEAHVGLARKPFANAPPLLRRSIMHVVDGPVVAALRAAVVSCALLGVCGCGGTTHRASTTVGPTPGSTESSCEGSNRALVFGGGHSACVAFRSVN